MEKNDITPVLKNVREKSPKRKFAQTFDLIINLRDLDIKKPEEKVELYIPLPHAVGKKVKICAFVDAALAGKAKETFDKVVTKEEFSRWAGNKKEQKKLATEYDYFIAQADLMTGVAATFGKVLGPKGKMPNPKAGCVVPANIPTLQPVKDKLGKLVKLQTKGELALKIPVGIETMNDEDITDNIHMVYTTVLSHLPQQKDNLKNVLLKLTMGPIFRLEAAKTAQQIARAKRQ